MEKCYKLSEALLELSKEYSNNERVIIGVWRKRDIEKIAKKIKIKLSNEDIEDIMDDIQNEFDVDDGINARILEKKIREFNDEDIIETDDECPDGFSLLAEEDED